MTISMVRGRFGSATGAPLSFVLRYDNWDDFGYSTLFDVYFFDVSGKRVEIGQVKVIRRGQEKGTHAEMPESPFEQLGEEYCSVGQGQDYYEALYSIPSDVREAYLIGVRDCAFNLAILHEFEAEDAFTTSVLRSVRKSDIPSVFRNILYGNATLTRFNFAFRLPSGLDDGIEVKVEPNSLPPTNLHVLIGRNGVGKTRLLSGIVDQITGRKPDGISVVGKIEFPKSHSEDERFTSLVSVAFSAFDQFRPVESNQISGNVRYSYIGLKKADAADRSTAAAGTELKSNEDLEAEFLASFELCVQGPKLGRWKNAISSLCSDPIFAELELQELPINFDPTGPIPAIFRKLSSGHKLVLLTITRLVEVVEEKTLVLIDEPETHLHPPLLASFINAISDLLINRNGVAIVATHSPVVLQEVPATCVTLVDRSGNEFSFNRPQVETYGENVGTLTREVFNLEVLESGFQRRIAKELEVRSYEELLHLFGHQIGAEGRALARVLSSKKQDN